MALSNVTLTISVPPFAHEEIVSLLEANDAEQNAFLVQHLCLASPLCETYTIPEGCHVFSPRRTCIHCDRPFTVDDRFCDRC